MKKSPLLAFFLAFIPGFGHMYLGHKIRGAIYALAFFGAIFLGFVSAVTMPINNEIMGFFMILAVFVWVVNLFDMVITLLTRTQVTSSQNGDYRTEGTTLPQNYTDQNERFFTILLSFIPGVGHFHMGLNQRGLTFLAGFFGVGTMVFFVSIMTNQGGFLIFLLAIPIIWIYSLFDAIQLLNKKQNGEMLEDRTVMDDLDRYREEGKKSRMLATVLSIFPGAGHMYLGLQKRGLQLMAAFLLSIYILDVLRLSLFLFLIPIIWFFSFFDALQQVNRVEEGKAEDVPVIKYFVNHQRWIGIILVLLGVFFIFDEMLLPLFADQMMAAMNIDIWYYYNRYFQVTIVCLILIGGGLKLLAGSKNKKGREVE